MQRDDLKKFDLPDTPGVYFFKDAKKKILYIGKATSLRDRVRSYFNPDLVEARSLAIVAMVDEASIIDYQETDSVLEALILEAHLIKTHQPVFNTKEKDNKSFNYLVFTKEVFPQILVVRGRELFKDWEQKDIKYIFGPFPNGSALREAMKIVRRIFPFRDEKCKVCDIQHISSCRPCFNRQIGLCPGICTGEVTQKEYAVTIKHLKELFSGNFKGLKRNLAKEMKVASDAEEFENAARIRRQITSLEHIRDVSLIKDENRTSSGGTIHRDTNIFRIEAYDTAHTSGIETVAVMTVIEDGELDKAAYRKFTIQTSTNDDVASLTEVLTRRLAHPEWPYPQLIVIDGGVTQLNAAERVLKRAGLIIPLVCVVKDEHHKARELRGDELLIKEYRKDIILINAEAHRFAITWHRKRRSNNSFNFLGV